MINLLLSFIIAFLSQQVLANKIEHDGLSFEIQSRPLGCDGATPKVKRVILESSLKLNKKFIPDQSDLEKSYREAIESQIKHLMGFYKNTKADGLNAVLFAYRGPQKITAIKNTTYGDSLELDSYLPPERGIGNDSYRLRALSIGKTFPNDEAAEIFYTAELIVSDCSQKDFETIKNILLPKDPYLSLWVNDKNSRSERNFGPYKLSSAPNCASDEIAKFGNGDQSWYFWAPYNKNCPHSSNAFVKAKITQVETIDSPSFLSKDFFKGKKSLNFSAIFGEISESDIFLSHDYEELRQIILGNFKECQRSELIPKCLTSWQKFLNPKESKYLEPGTYSFIAFLKMLNTIVKLDSLEIDKKSAKEEIIVNIRGKLSSSKIPLQLHIYFGHTSLDHGKTTESYVRFLHHAFTKSDVISYVGHAGLGSNVLLKNIKHLWSESKLALPKREDPLWLGLYNCEGLSYFGFDLTEIYGKNKIEAIETFTSGKLAGPQFPLFHLQVLDKIYSDEKVQISDVFKPKNPSIEFLTETWLSSK